MSNRSLMTEDVVSCNMTRHCLLGCALVASLLAACSPVVFVEDESGASSSAAASPTGSSGTGVGGAALPFLIPGAGPAVSEVGEVLFGQASVGGEVRQR